MCSLIKSLCNKKNCEICFERSFDSHEKSQFWSIKNNLKPREVFKSSNDKYLFDCNCGHEFLITLGNIVGGKWCSFCSNKKLCDNEECMICYEKSFASHEKSNYIKNKEINNPRQIFKRGEKKIEFTCEICNHDFISMVGNVVRLNSWCPYCSIPTKLLCLNEDCEKCHERSFASHEKSQYWSKKNIIKPREILKTSNTKFLFDCECGHEFENTLGNITVSNQWCPYCCNSSQKVCDDVNCERCYEKSFASHEKSQFWSKKNKVKPRNIMICTAKKYWFDCNYCGSSFEQKISYITSRNIWCNICIYKTQKKIHDFLKVVYVNVITEKKFDWCKNKKTNQLLRYDYLLTDLDILIELDGPQHFKNISNWGNYKDTQERDIYKMNEALKNNYTVIRILQNDVLNDKYDWKLKLIENIKFYLKPKIKFIDKNDEYNEYKNLFKKKM